MSGFKKLNLKPKDIAKKLSKKLVATIDLKVKNIKIYLKID